MLTKRFNLFLIWALLASIFTSCSNVKNIDLLIRDVQLFDGEQVLEHADIYVKKGVIVKIDSNKTKFDWNIKRIVEGNYKTLIPGLIKAYFGKALENL
jgi:N-acyl-D-aspartate/D-glutamate deacylase